MRDFKQEIADRVASLDIIKKAGLDGKGVYSLIEAPKDPGLGDYAFPCFRLSKALAKPPQAIATEAAEALAATAIPAPMHAMPVERAAAR